MARPRKFDEADVLDMAAEAFWTKGFEATSTRDLTECTGLTQSSIYAAFGDKRGLFLRALKHYFDRVLHERIARLEVLRPGQAIGDFFTEVIERSLADPRHRGCMLVNTALEATPDDPELQRYVAQETVMIEDFFKRCIAAGQASGEFPADRSAADGARHLLAVLLGLRVLVRVRPDAALLTGLVSPALATLGLVWPDLGWLDLAGDDAPRRDRSGQPADTHSPNHPI
ncbi:TetR/AcrR family transcriptional regulator [Roseiarcaceae bacterium H3SJ34-1]|uniref:TetR/AcrR family transcriptional regulator n=1 Tax=Terripilifer ovatus TaxID=3032367 RepID=UPI003AB9313A|nr:TetR/AcrR family transcriptional regulator [Roseiarcaceae bacterium H3SJ34-1]